MEFIMDNYIWIMLILAVALLACIGYFVDKKEKKVKKEKLEKELSVNNTVNQNIFDSSVVEKNEQPQVDEVRVEEYVQPMTEETISEVTEPVAGENGSEVVEPVAGEIGSEVVEPVAGEIGSEVAEPVAEETEPIEQQFEEIESFEPITSVENVMENNNQEELIPVEQPRSELIDNTDELLLSGDPTIDQDFKSLLEDEELEELEVELPPIEETKKEDFKSIDDDDEDLWTF